MTRSAFSIVALGAVLSGAVDAGDAERAGARLVWADFDGDGLEDVYVVRPEGRDSLFRNAGDGSFEDVTAQALPCVSCAALEVLWRDVDLDRRPDLLRLLVSGGVELLRNRGDGVFEDVTLAAGLEHVSGASTARWLDYDADGRADLEVTTVGAPLVFHNLGDFLFETLTFDEVAGTSAPQGAQIVRATPGALDEAETSAPSLPNAPSDDHMGASRRAVAGASAVLTGSVLDEVHPDPLVVGTPAVDPLEPNPEVEFQLPPFANRCAWSVKDTSTGDCVLTSTIPTLGKLYPISANLFVSTSGDVGIGTTSPAAKLDVAGTARITDTLTLAPSGDQALDVSTGSIYKGGLPFAHTRGGASNTALGQEALTAVTTGSSNTASGFRALYSNTTGFNNTATGVRALHQNTSGARNTVSGYRALYSNTTGFNNTANGVAALRDNTTGSGNTASGYRALFANTTGNSNTASGVRSLNSNTTGNRNTASGYRALYANTTGANNTAHGGTSLRDNTTGSGNTASGDSALRFNTTGVTNTATGYKALYANNIGISNTAAGGAALRDNTSGDQNTAIGHSALLTNTIGNGNTASGSLALYANTTGDDNTAAGRRALRSNTTGDFNTASGHRALHNNTTGARNIALGADAGYNLTTGNDNIVIGNTGNALDGATIRLGTAGTQTRTFIAGIRGVTTSSANAIPVLVDSVGQLGTISSSGRFKKDIEDMGERTDRLLELRPVVFRYKQDQKVPVGEVPLEYGLIAEEVAEIFPDLVVYDEEGLPFTVKYHLLSSMLLNELKEQSTELVGLQDQLEAQAERLAALEARSAPVPQPSTLPVSNL